jgi:hypothetical protein
MGYTLIWQPEAAAQFDALVERYSADVVDTALTAVYWGLATTPQAYDRVTGHIYAAKTRPLRLIIPPLRLLFQIPNDQEVVILWIEDVGETDTIRKLIGPP